MDQEGKGDGEVSPMPVISVVIPTEGSRPELVEAVTSVLDDYAEDCAMEVIVVADGRESELLAVVEQLDARVSVVLSPLSLGASCCRTIGIRRATGRIIAFLDDDDIWLPGRAATLYQYRDSTNLILASSVLRKHEGGRDTVPDRAPRTGEHLSEFLFRRGVRPRAAFLQTSGLAATRDVAQGVGFRPLLARHQDFDFLLRALYVYGAQFEFLERAAAEWRVDEPRGSAFRHPAWRNSRAWCMANPQLFSRRGRGSFLATVVSEAAAAEGHRWAAFRCAFDALRKGGFLWPEAPLAFYWTLRGRRR